MIFITCTLYITYNMHYICMICSKYHFECIVLFMWYIYFDNMIKKWGNDLTISWYNHECTHLLYGQVHITLHTVRTYDTVWDCAGAPQSKASQEAQESTPQICIIYSMPKKSVCCETAVNCSLSNLATQLLSNPSALGIVQALRRLASSSSA